MMKGNPLTNHEEVKLYDKMNKEISNQREMKIKRLKEERKRKNKIKARSSKASVSKSRVSVKSLKHVNMKKRRPIMKSRGEKKVVKKKKKKLTYDPLDIEIMEGKEFSLTYNPLDFRKEKDDADKQFELLYQNNGSKLEAKKLEKKMKMERKRKEQEIKNMEDQLPTYQKHLPRQLPRMMKNLNQSIQNSISNYKFYRSIAYKERIDKVRRQNMERFKQKKKQENKSLVIGLAKLKGIDLEKTIVKRKGNSKQKRSRSRGSVSVKGLNRVRPVRSKSRNERKPKKEKKLKPEDDPDFIYCFRCGEHHHKSKHLLVAPGYRNTNVERKPARKRNMVNPFNPPNEKRNKPRKEIRNISSSNSYLGKRSSPYSQEEEDEYEGDFIDDGPIQQEPAYLRELRKITGYNPDKFRHLDLMDDRNMEVRNYEELEREDRRTARLARIEDKREEDILKKIEERKRKMIR